MLSIASSMSSLAECSKFKTARVNTPFEYAGYCTTPVYLAVYNHHYLI